jgi:hypothetical protein
MTTRFFVRVTFVCNPGHSVDLLPCILPTLRRNDTSSKISDIFTACYLDSVICKTPQIDTHFSVCIVRLYVTVPVDESCRIQLPPLLRTPDIFCHYPDVTKSWYRYHFHHVGTYGCWFYDFVTPPACWLAASIVLIVDCKPILCIFRVHAELSIQLLIALPDTSLMVSR